VKLSDWKQVGFAVFTVITFAVVIAAFLNATLGIVPRARDYPVLLLGGVLIVIIVTAVDRCVRGIR